MTGVVLAGGKSTRMGTNKAVLEVGGRTLIESVVEKLHALFPEVLIIANSPELYETLGPKVFPDLIPDKGSLGGLYTGLFYASYAYAFFAACDMPFLNPDLITFMKAIVEEGLGPPPSGHMECCPYDVVIPKAQGELHPLHAIYSKRCLPFMRELIDRDHLKIVAFFPQVRVKVMEEETIRRFDPSLLSLFNANTPEELALARQLSKSVGSLGF